MALLVVYAGARLLQVFPTRVPTLLIVVLHVLSPAIFAGIHGRRVFGGRGIVVFTMLCLAVGTFFESLSLRTGFPFGHYYFTGVMGPKVFDLPILLALAYVGVGYLAWVVASLLVGARASSGQGTFVLPWIAAAAMCAWDLAMDPVWANIDHAWVWLDGGGYFGVPFSNYFGWLLTTWVFYQAFALWLRRQEPRVATSGWDRPGSADVWSGCRREFVAGDSGRRAGSVSAHHERRCGPAMDDDGCDWELHPRLRFRVGTVRGDRMGAGRWIQAGNGGSSATESMCRSGECGIAVWPE